MGNLSTPNLRFPDFNGEWIKKKLGELSIINPTTFKLPDKFIYIDLESVTNGQLIKEEVVFKSKAPSRAQRVLERDDILFQMVRPYQKNNLYFDKNGDYVASTGYAQIKTKQSSRFLYQYLHLKKFVDEVIERCTGTSYPAINSKDLAKINIRYPSLPEQQKIASFFTAIDQKIFQLKRNKTLLEQYKKGVMQKIFTQQISFKDDNGQEFPKWEKKKLGDVGKTYNGLTGKSKDDFGQGKPYIQYKQIFDDTRIDITRFDFVRIGDGEKQSRVRTGDVFFTTSSETPDEVGTSSVLLDEVSEVYLNSFCFGYRSSPEVLIPKFSRYLFRNELLRKEINKLSQGSTRYNLSKNELMKTVIELPSIHEQTKIANFLSSIDDKINNTRKQIEKAEVWKKGLMQQMFV